MGTGSGRTTRASSYAAEQPDPTTTCSSSDKWNSSKCYGSPTTTLSSATGIAGAGFVSHCPKWHSSEPFLTYCKSDGSCSYATNYIQHGWQSCKAWICCSPESSSDGCSYWPSYECPAKSTKSCRYSTHNIQSTPLNRQMSQTPRMSQGSPMQASMAAMQGVPMMNGQQMPVMNSQQAQALQQQQQRMQQMMRNNTAQQQQQQQAAMGGMVPQQMTPQQQQQFMQAQHMMRNQHQAGQQQGMPNQLAQTYAAQMAAMAQRSGGLPPNMDQNMMNNNPGMAGMPQMTMQQMQQQMQMQQMRQQAQAQAHAQAQQNPQAVAQQQMFQQQVMIMAQQLYGQQRPKVAASYANGILPDEIERQLRAQCQSNAQQSVQRRFQAQRAQQQQQMMAQAQAQGMQQNMNGMQGGMGM